MGASARLHQQPRRVDQVVASELDGEMVLLNLATEEHYSLNEVGTRLWDLTDGKRTVAEMIDTILQEYEAERAGVTEDVLALFQELTDEGLVAWNAAWGASAANGHSAMSRSSSFAVRKATVTGKPNAAAISRSSWWRSGSSARSAVNTTLPL